MEISWLDDLEEKVRLATQRIEALTDENRTLRGRIEELVSDSGETGDEAAGWTAEKEAIRERVERLAAGLESLLG